MYYFTFKLKKLPQSDIADTYFRIFINICRNFTSKKRSKGPAGWEINGLDHTTSKPVKG
jgi:hypothetical protein